MTCRPIAQGHGLVGKRSFRVLAKPAGARCNLDCDYCFYLDKRGLYPGSDFRMSKTVLERFLTEIIESHSGRDVSIAWQGGEPTLMGLGFFAHAVAKAQRLALPGQRIEHSLQTNGTLLDDRWGAFLKQHDFLVGISIDGPESIHNSHRRDKRGGPSFSKTMRGLEILKKHGVRYNVLCAVSSTNVDYPTEVYRFLRDECEARYLQFIPIAATEPGSKISHLSVAAESWGWFLSEIFDIWFRHDVGKIFVQIFESSLAAWLGLANPMCIFAETCGRNLALEHTGDLYSCDHFVDQEHRLGNILSETMASMVESPPQLEFGASKQTLLATGCRSCPVLFACQGECPKNRLTPTAIGERINSLCAGYKSFFLAADGPMRMLAKLIRAGRFADELYTLLSSMDPTIMCPCGSGIELAQCHLPDRSDSQPR